MSGRISRQPAERSTIGLAVPFDLEPYGSRVIVFPRNGGSAIATAAPVSPRRREADQADTTIDLSSDWNVTFQPGGRGVALNRLRSWTDEDATRYFSGVATYEKSVMVSNTMIADGRRVSLDFGEGRAIPPQQLRSGMQAWLDAPVREAAVVYVNDRRVGSVWCPPYSIEVTEFLSRGSNRLRIAVANLAINEMAGRALPDYRLLNLRYGTRFEPQDMDQVQPVPAGLLGAIRLVSYAVK
jgi:hypothetical protein